MITNIQGTYNWISALLRSWDDRNSFKGNHRNRIKFIYNMHGYTLYLCTVDCVYQICNITHIAHFA